MLADGEGLFSILAKLDSDIAGYFLKKKYAWELPKGEITLRYFFKKERCLLVGASTRSTFKVNLCLRVGQS